LPTEPLVIGAFSQLYVGDASPSSAVLTLISARRTDGSELDSITPRQFEDSVNNYVQSGRRITRIPFVFYGVDDNVMRLANGLSINPLVSTDPDAPTTNQKYLMLFVAPDVTTKESVLFPVCATETRVRYGRSKQRPTSIPLNIIWECRNAYIKPYHRGTLAELLARPEMSGRSPF
jgi:hypothetical protein